MSRVVLALVLAWSLVAGARAQDTAGMGGLPIGGGGGSTPTTTAPHVLSSRAGVPADGAILIESPDGSEPVVLISDPSGVLLDGTLDLLSSGAVAFYAWRPAAGFTLGTYRVTLSNPSDAFLRKTFDVEIVEPMGRELPALTTSPNVVGLVAASARACCTTPLRDELTLLCALSEERSSALLEPGLESTESLTKLNQFLFRVRASEGSVAHVENESWRPFGLATPLQLIEEADAYCFELEALDIATREVHVYSDLVRCAPRGDVAVGVMTVPLPPSLLADEECLQPPAGREAEWCGANRDACDDGVTAECKLFRYACQHGPLPQPWRNAAALYPERNIPLNGNEPAPGHGCSVSAPSVHAAAFGLAAVALALALRTRRRARPRR